jgi:transposase
VPELREAFAGRFDDHHALLIGEMMAQLDQLEETIARLSERIEERIAPFPGEVEPLDTIPAVDKALGRGTRRRDRADMARSPSAGHLASWARLGPGNSESAGKRKSGHTRKGSKWLRATQTDSAKAAARTRGSYLSAHYHRLRGRRGPNNATIAVATRSSSAPTTCSTATSPTPTSARTTSSTARLTTPTATARGASPTRADAQGHAGAASGAA